VFTFALLNQLKDKQMRLQENVTLKGKDGSQNTLSLQNAGLAKEKLRAILNPLRVKIIQTISNYGETDVTAIYKKLRIEQSVCSVMLKDLRGANLVTTRREGKQIFYSVNSSEVKRLGRLVNEIVGSN
jgi:DNA-binding transcriptional ArsR family regulator